MTAASNDPTPSEAEAEVEQARAGLANTLHQLRENFKPANVADEVLVNARRTTTVVTDQVWAMARRNPLSAVLIGAGAAVALGLGSKAVSVSDPQPPGSGFEHDRLEQERKATPLALHGSPDRVAFKAGDLLDVANDGLRLVAHRARTVFKQTRENPTSSQETSMTGSSHPRDRIKQSVSRAIDDQPLMLAVLGIAAGAAIGALMPKTEAENSLMGDRAHALRDQARSVTQDRVDTLKAAAAHAVEGIKQTVSEHGVSGENLSGLVHDVGEHAKRAAYEAGRSLDQAG